MFDSFRSFFLAVFWLHLSCYVGGLTIRIRRQPLVVLTLLLGLFAIFKPYPSISRLVAFPRARAAVPPRVPAHALHVCHCRHHHVRTTFLGPAFYHLWIYAGSGNANFFYAITLVWGLGQSLLVCDLTFAVLAGRVGGGAARDGGQGDSADIEPVGSPYNVQQSISMTRMM